MDKTGLKNEIDFYEPNEDTRHYISRVALYGIIGPTGAGKTTIMRQLVEDIPSKVQIALSDTDRKPRPGEVDGQDYHFRSTNQMMDSLRERDFVQVALSPTGSLYATRPESYSQEKMNLMAILSQEVELFRSLGFKSLRLAFLVPQHNEEWPSLNNNPNINRDELQKRKQEAIASYDFGLAQQELHPGSISFILNDKIPNANRRMRQFYFGDNPDAEARAKEIARKNLAELKK